MADSLLNGLRALDLTDEKGYLCGKILADLGVDVIKIEKPGGDPARNTPPFYHDTPDPKRSLYWFAYNMNKRGITLNIETTQGQDLFRKLVNKSDFVIEAFPPGYMNSLGLGYEAISRVNPQIIMTSITPFGQSGPYSVFKASDIVIEALGVLLKQFGDPDRAPVRVSVPQAYMHAGGAAAEGTMLAHYYRSVTGEGQHVDVSAMEAVMYSTTIGTMPSWDASKTTNKRGGSFLVFGAHISPNVWECKDGYVMFQLIGGLAGARNNKALTEWMDSENMAPIFMKEKNWPNWDFWNASQDEVDALAEAIRPFFKAHTKEELQDSAIKRRIMLYKVSDSADAVNSVQLKARNYWINIEHDELGDTITYPGAFAKLSLTPIAHWRRAPLIGENNDEIYGKELGLSENELAVLKANGTI